MSNSSQQMQSFEIAKVPDQKLAGELVRKLLEHKFEIRTEDDYTAHAVIIAKHDELITMLTKGTETVIGFDPLIASLHNSHKMAIAMRNQFLDPVLVSKQSWLDAGKAFKNKQEAAAEEQRKKDAAKLQRQEVKALTKDAARLEKAGDVDAAEVLREQAQNVPLRTLPAAPAVPRAANLVERGGWKFEVEDYDKVPDEFKQLDHRVTKEREIIDSKIRSVALKLGDKIKIEGVRIYWDQTTSSRRV